MQTSLKKKLGKQKRRILRFLKGQTPKYADYNRIHKHYIKTESPVIFDVGAHNGESVERFKDIFPHSSIHSFEADQENYDRLCVLYKNRPGVILNHFAAGSEPGTKTFYRNIKSDTSSFIPVNPNSEWAKLRSQQHNVTPDQFTQKAYEIRLDTLDNYIAQNGLSQIDILKMDTQGFEDEVLKGAQKSLMEGRIKVIETELIMGDLYEKYLSFYDLEQILVPAGFKLCAIDHSANRIDNPSMTFNIIYAHASIL